MRIYKYILLSALSVMVTFILHEFSHWTMGEFLGYDMTMTLNTAFPTKGSYDTDWHYTLISAVGPFYTLLQALVFFQLIRKYHDRYLYTFLFTAFYLELLSGIMNAINPNDLGRISTTFGLGLFTLSIVFVAAHSLLIYLTSKGENYTGRFNMTTLLWIILFSSIWILSNQFFKIVLI